MPSYKLHYFPVRGRGEGIRYLFAYTGTPYEDVRIPKDKWPEQKSKFLFGQLPVLEVDGKQLAQSNAIARFVAKRSHSDLLGKNDLEESLADMYVDGINDLYPTLIPVIRAKFAGDAALEKENWEKFKNDSLKPFLDRYEGFVAKQNTGYLVGLQVSWADILLGEFLERMDSCFESGILKDYPKLAELVKKVHALPGIKEHVASRPSMPL